MINLIILTCAFRKVEISLGALIAKRPGKVLETRALQRALGDAHRSAALRESETQIENVYSDVQINVVRGCVN